MSIFQCAAKQPGRFSVSRAELLRFVPGRELGQERTFVVSRHRLPMPSGLRAHQGVEQVQADFGLDNLHGAKHLNRVGLQERCVAGVARLRKPSARLRAQALLILWA